MFPHFLPRGLLYEIAILDLIVRDKLSRLFPSFKQSWWHQIVPGLYLGGIPLSDQNHLEQIKFLGAGSVLAILEDDEAENETFFSTPVREHEWRASGIDYRRLSCPDMHPMSMEELEESILWLNEQVEAGRTVYVHCKAGRGRSAMIVLAYLIVFQKMNLQDAIAYLSSIRSVVRFRPSQLERLEEFVTSNNLCHSRA